MAQLTGWTVSEGTLRNDDLVQAFEIELKHLNEAEYDKLRADYGDFLDVWDPIMDDPKGYAKLTGNGQDTLAFYLLALVEALEANAPEGLYFGAIEGDGACFGFWPLDEDEAEFEPD